MKTLFVELFSLAAIIKSDAQGYLTVGNHFGLTFRAPIYSAALSDPYRSIQGQSAIGTPSGTTAYLGPLLQGTGFTFSVYFAPAGANDYSAFSLLYSTTFRTATGNGLPAGLVFPQTVTVPGVGPGERAKLQVRVWNNFGGTVTSWSDSWSRGASQVFLSEPLGGIGYNYAESALEIYLTPDMTGWSSFDIYPAVPEPSAWMVAALLALVGCQLRKRRFV